MEDSEQQEPHWVVKTVYAALTPLRLAISKPALKAYLGTLIFFFASCILIGISSFAFGLFYYNFVPQLSVQHQVHLQFGDHNPYGQLQLGSEIVPMQPYDVTVELHLPRTQSNIAAGNFMLDLSLLSAPTLGTADLTANLVGQARRAAMLTYASPLVELAHRLFEMPLYLLGWRTEAETLEIQMLDGHVFGKGVKSLPQTLKLEIQSKESMQIYHAKVNFIARLKGLRWFMYRYRLIAFLMFTSVFWSVSMLSASIAWLLLSSYLAPTQGTIKNEGIKEEGYIKEEPVNTDDEEEAQLSHSSRTFPAIGKREPLRYTAPSSLSERSRSRSSTLVKKEEQEEEEEEDEDMPRTYLEPLTGEAGDEEDDGDSQEDGGGRRTDSGLGTSLEESSSRKVQRRRSRAFDDPNF